MGNRVESDNVLIELARWAWLTFGGFVLHIYRKLTGLETQTQLLKQQQDNFEKQSEKDQTRYQTQRQEDQTLVETHRTEQRETAKGIYDRLDTITIAVGASKSDDKRG